MKKKLVIIATICIVVIITIILIQKNLFNKETRQKIGNIYCSVIKEENPSIEDAIPAIAITPRWDELTIAQQFGTAKYNDNIYDSKNTEISSDMIGDNLGTAVLTGLDVYKEAQNGKNATLYAVKDFPQECVIAVQFEGRSDYFVYINAYYRPNTLGEFIEDLNLKETVSFGSVYYDDFIDGKYTYFEFPNVTDDIIWQMLFDDVSVKNVHSDTEYHDTLMSIGVDIPLLGYKNISVSITEDGYLTTNILDTGKTFYIGEDKVQEFMNYIFDNYEAEATVYNSTDDDSNEEVEDEVIMKVENKF